VGLNLKFHYVIDCRLDSVSIADRAVVVDPVQQEHVATVALTVHRGENKVSNRFRRESAGIARWIGGAHARSQQKQLSEITAVERKTIDLLRSDDVTQFGSRSLHLGGLGGNVDSGRSGSHLKAEIDGRRLVYFQGEFSLLLGCESFFTDL